VKIFCFSGTGNSYSVASEIGAHFSVKPELITGFVSKGTIEVLDSQIGIIAPVYLNDIPKVVKEFILRFSFADTNKFVFVVLTSGSGRNKNGFKNTCIALAQHHVRLALAYDILMPSSFQDRADMESVLSAVPDKVAEITKAIEDKRENFTLHGSIELPKNFTKLSVMYRPLSRMQITEKCIGCGLCSSLCPTSNIEIGNERAVRGKNCIACTACANWCPHNAIKSRMLKGQYRHPEVNATDLLKLGIKDGKNEY